jgi:hypothetical protein
VFTEIVFRQPLSIHQQTEPGGSKIISQLRVRRFALDQSQDAAKQLLARDVRQKGMASTMNQKLGAPRNAQHNVFA